MKQNASAENSIRAMSGRDCFDTVDTVDAELTRELAVKMWRAMWRAIDGLCPDFAGNVDLRREPPNISIVRTPRAHPYSFVSTDGPHIVIDQHLLRLTHRWSRIAETSAQEGPALFYEFDDLYAERFYLVGEFGFSAYCRSSYRKYASGRKGLPTLPRLKTEAAFRSRSGAQHLFIIGHELAHAIVLSLPVGALDEIRCRILEAYSTGLPPEPGGREASESIFGRISGSNAVATECLCDSLSLAGLFNFSYTFEMSLAAASDAVGLLSVLYLADRSVSAYLREARGAGGASIDGHETITTFEDFFARRVALIWLSNCAQVILRRFGLTGRAVSLSQHAIASTEKVEKVLDSFADFVPGLGVSHDASDAELALMVIAMQSRASARAYLGFADPVTPSGKPTPQRSRRSWSEPADS